MTRGPAYLALAWLAGATPAPAQTPDATPASLDRIVVTAQKREQAAQDVAIALAVLRGEQLRERGIARVEDLQHATPSLEVEPAFGSQQAQFRLRGVGFVDYMTNNSSPVGVSLDGVAYAFPVQTAGLLFDLARVEVLRGPQGALYGRNTTAGAINLVSAAPSAAFDAGVRIDTGTAAAREVEAFVTGAPLAGLRARLSLLRAAGGAWQRHRDTGEALGDADVSAWRAQLDADLAAGWQAQLDVQQAIDRSDGRGLQLLAPFAPAFGGPAIAADRDRRTTAWGLRPDFAARVGLDPDARPGRDNRGGGAALTVLGASDRVTFTSISAINRLLRREYADYDATPYAESDQFFRSRIRSLSQELRLQSDPRAAWAWTAGAYAARERLDEESFEDFTARLGGDLLTEYRQDSATRALFGQLDWNFAPAWRAGLGLRRDRETRELSDFVTRFLTPPLVFAGPARRGLVHSGNSGKLALEWRPDARTLWYASASRGFKSGGFTAHNTADAATLDPFAPETLVAREAGFKREFGGGVLRLEGALFHYDYRDQQVLSAYFEPLSQSLVGIFVNAPRSRIRGAELQLEWQAGEGLAISQFIGWKRGRYTAPFVTFDPVASLASGTNVFSDYDGKALDFPRLSYGGRIARRFELAAGAFEAAASYAYRDRYEQELLLGPGFGLDGYWLANAELAWTPRDARWSLGLWARNLLDARYDLTRNYFLPGTDVVARAPPRSLGVRFEWRH
jgi:outer membrane receptor protein involved in Fe transport